MPVDSTAEPQTLSEVWAWQLGVIESVEHHREAIRRATVLGENPGPTFAMMAESEVESHFDALRRNLDRLTVLNLVASAEATIKADYFRRVGEKPRTAGARPLSHAYRALDAALPPPEKHRPPFAGRSGILRALKEAKVIDNHVLGAFGSCLRARHWVGHGRYWGRPAEIDLYPPDEVYRRAEAIVVALSRVP